MRFLIYTQYFPPEVGAAQTRLAAMARELKGHGHDVEVVTALPNYAKSEIFPEYKGKFYLKEEWEGCTIHRFWLYAAQGKGIKRILNYFSFMIITTFGIFKAQKPDWIFVNSGPLFLSIPAFIASRIWGVPFIFNVSDLWARSVTQLKIFENKFLLKILKRLETWSYQQAEIVNAVTEGVKEVLINEDHIPSGKVCFLPNGVDIDMFYPRMPSQRLLDKYNIHGKHVFIYPGTHGFAHALDKILDTAKLFKEEDKVHFMFIGGGSEKEKLLYKAEAENISNVTFVDPLQLVDLAEHLSLASWGLIHQKNTPLANETRPAKSYPILAMGKPILFCGFGEGAKLIEDAKAGVVIPPEDPQGIKDTILKLIKMPHVRDEMGINARQFVIDNFTWKKITHRWLSELFPLQDPNVEKPLVSIITPAYNAARFIEETIKSVQAQSYTNWEMLVVNNGSADNTGEVVERIAAQDKRIIHIYSLKRLGPAEGRNTAIRKARGRYLAFLDSDDLWLPQKLETQLNYMLRGKYALTYSRFRRMSEDGKNVGRLLPISQSTSYDRLLLHNIIGTLTVMVDRAQFNELEMTTEGNEDFILWLKILRMGLPAFGIQNDLARYRVVGGSVSRNKIRAAWWVWKIYRQNQGLGIRQAIWCFLNYALRVSYKYTRF